MRILLKGGLGVSAALWAVCGSLSLLPADDAVEQGGLIGQEELIQRVLERDPELAALRRQVLQAEAGLKRAAPIRDPEIRLGYASTSRSAVPDPFTEVREVTTTEQETRQRDRSRQVAGQSREDRTDISAKPGDPLQPDASEIRTSSIAGTEQDSESTRSQQTTRRTTIRDVVPGRSSTVIRERTVETRRESATTSGTESEQLRGSELQQPTSRIPVGADPLDFLPTEFSFSETDAQSQTEQSDEQVRVVEETIEERFYDNDPYEGSDDYSVQLRLYPRHPWEMRAEKGMARDEISLAEFVVEAMERDVALAVRDAFQDLQYRSRELTVLDRRIRHATEDLALKAALYEAGRITMDKVADLRLDALDVRLEREARAASFEAARDELAARAGVTEPERFDLNGPIHLPTIDVATVELDGLSEIAIENRAELGVLERQDGLLERELAINRAGRIPWLSLVSGSYNYEERYGSKYRDEYSVVAGFNVPVFAWFRGDSKFMRAERSQLQRDVAVVEDRVGLELRHAMGRVARHQAASRQHAEEVQAFREEVQAVLATLPSDSLAGREQHTQLNRTLAELQMRLLEVNRAYADAVLELERVVGCPWNEAAALLSGEGL